MVAATMSATLPIFGYRARVRSIPAANAGRFAWAVNVFRMVAMRSTLADWESEHDYQVKDRRAFARSRQAGGRAAQAKRRAAR
jgi:hypothetical protein